MNIKIERPLRIILSFIICCIVLVLSNIFPSIQAIQISTLLLFVFPGYLMKIAIFNDFTFNAKNIACYVILSSFFLVFLVFIDLYVLNLFPFRLVYFFALLMVFSFALLKTNFGPSPPISKASKSPFENKSLLFLLVIMIVFFAMASLTLRTGYAADNDAYGYISIGKLLFSQGSSIIDWSNLKLNWVSLLQWQGSSYQPLYVGVDRIGFVLFEGSFGQIAGTTLQSGQILAIFFYSLLALATYLLGTLILRKASALIAACLVGFIPFILWYSNHVLTEIPMTVFAVFAIFFFCEYVKNFKKGDFFFFVISIILSLFMKPMAIVLLFPLLIFTTLVLFRNNINSNFKLSLWLLLWSIPFVGSIVLSRFRTSGSFREVLASIVNVFSSNSSFIPTILNNFSPFFLTPTLIILSIVGLPFMFSRKNWKTSLMLLLSMIALIIFVTSLGVIEPREAIIVYPFMIISVAAFFDKLIRETHLHFLVLTLPFIGIFSAYLFVSYRNLGSFVLSPSFTITQGMVINQIEISLIFFFVLSFLEFYLLLKKRTPQVYSNNRLKKLTSKIKPILLLICISIIILEGLFETNGLLQGGAWGNISIKQTGIGEVADYINYNTTSDGPLMTTLMASASLNYLTSRTVYQLPQNLSMFYLSIQQKQFDYLVLTPSSSIIWNPQPKYIDQFIYVAPEGMHLIYQNSSTSSMSFKLNQNDSLHEWVQSSNQNNALIEDGQIMVGGGNADSGLISQEDFSNGNLTISVMLSSPNSLNSPQIGWNDSVNFCAVYYFGSEWTLESNFGNVTFSSLPGILDLNTYYNVTLNINSASVAAYINGQLLGVQQSAVPTVNSGNIIIKSTYASIGLISNVTVTETTVNLAIYARDGIN